MSQPNNQPPAPPEPWAEKAAEVYMARFRGDGGWPENWIQKGITELAAIIASHAPQAGEERQEAAQYRALITNLRELVEELREQASQPTTAPMPLALVYRGQAKVWDRCADEIESLLPEVEEGKGK